VLFSVANKLELAVAGGKHATGGSSSTDGGLCIDLSKMRGVTVDAEKKTARAQGGALVCKSLDVFVSLFGYFDSFDYFSECLLRFRSFKEDIRIR
jgi:FAD/FMN-containing dehydrogenase